MSDPVSDLPSDESIINDIEEMIKLVKSEKFYGPYGITTVDENGDLIDFLVDEDGNVVYDHSDSE